MAQDHLRNVVDTRLTVRFVLVLLPVFLLMPILAATTGRLLFIELADALLAILTLPGLIAVGLGVIGFLATLAKKS